MNNTHFIDDNNYDDNEELPRRVSKSEIKIYNFYWIFKDLI